MDNKQCLTANEMAVISTVFAECFEIELTKQSEAQKIKISAFILQQSNEIKLHTLFTQNGLKTITETVFNDSDIRDFVLCLTDQFRCVTALSDLNIRSIEYSIGYGLNSPEIKDNKFILIPERIYDNMELSGDLITSILSANHWLLSLVMMYLFFGKTSIYNQFIENDFLSRKV